MAALFRSQIFTKLLPPLANAFTSAMTSSVEARWHTVQLYIHNGAFYLLCV